MEYPLKLLWLRPVAVFAFTLLLFMAARRWLWRRFRQRVGRDEQKEALLRGTAGPTDALLLLGAATLAYRVAPENMIPSEIASTLRLLALIAVVWFVDRISVALLTSDRLTARIGKSSRTLFLTLARIVYFSLAMLILLDALGIPLSPFLASIGITSVAIAVSLQETLNNFINGLYLLIDKPIQIGDFISIDDQTEGYVERIGWRSSRIRLLSGSHAILPNQRIASSRLVNYELPRQEMAVAVHVSVAASGDLKKIEKVTLETAENTLHAVEGGGDFFPFVRFCKIRGPIIEMIVVLQGQKFKDPFRLRHEFIKSLHSRYSQEAIQLA